MIFPMSLYSSPITVRLKHSVLVWNCEGGTISPQGEITSPCGTCLSLNFVSRCSLTRINRSAGQQRVVDTATYFLRGYLSQGNYLNDTSKNRGTIFFMPDSVLPTGADSLTASAACPAYSGNNGTNLSNAFRASYQPAIAARINTMLDGLALNGTDIGVMQDLCGFGFVINGNPEWCHVFTGELLILCVIHIRY